MSKNRVIGRNNDLPWHLPDDFKFFKDKTKNHHVIMGRKNFESLPPKFSPLPDRVNIILTKNPTFIAPKGTIVLQDLNEAISLAIENGDNEPFIIGGGEIYKLGLEVSDQIYLTEIDAIMIGDTFFPKIDKTKWIESNRVHHPEDDKHNFPFDFVTYKKRKDE